MRLSLIIILLILVSALVNAVEVDKNVEKELVKDGGADVIIKFNEKSGILRSNVNAESIVSSLNDDEFEGNFFKNTKFAAGNLSRKGIEKLKNNNNVEKIILDYPIKASIDTSTILVNSSLVNTLKVRGANNLTGKGVSVCIIDTGVNSSLSNFGSRVISGYDYVNNDNNPADDNGHGTHVAGIVASSGSLSGVAPEANIIAMKVLDSSGSGLASNLINGIQWCIDNSTKFNISVITMSLGCGVFDSNCDSTTTCNADLIAAVVNDAVGKNISVISSSGNKGDGTQSSGSNTHISVPACITNVTAVGAVDKDYTIASYGNRNSLTLLLTLLMAPGTSIKSLRYNQNSCLSGCSCSGEFMTCSGTSMAAPHVAGIYALIIQYLRDENNSLMTNLQIEDVLNRTGMEVIDSATNVRYKFTDVYKAILHLDNFAPDLVLDNPKNRTYKTSNISLNFSSLDTNINSSWYNINNGANISLIRNTSLNLSDGSYILNLYSNDTNGNSNSSSTSFIINSNIPTVNLISPDNNAIDYDGNVTFNCSANSNVELKNISLWHNLSGIFKLNQSKNINGLSNSAEFNINLSNRQFIWSCLVYNTNESYEFGENRTGVININHNPKIISYLPNSSSASVNENAGLSFNHTSTDEDGNSLTYYWHLDNVLKSNAQNYAYTPNYTESGSHTVSLVVGDGIFNTSFNWSVTVNDVVACGNSILETGEECEGSNLNGQGCSSKGFSGGTLSCSSSCTFDTSACTTSSSGSSSGGSGGSSGGGSGGGTPISEPDTSEFNEGIPPTQEEPKKEEQKVELATNSIPEEVKATEEVKEEPKPAEGITGFSVYTESIKNFALGALGIIFVLGLLRFIIKRDLLKFEKKG
ncbi:S8 family serine peptidase [Candidatus Woesearchaeota archaeon]|nr:S8 family serine peptidase [Candidatus Woesearchaeota archaeon]